MSTLPPDMDPTKQPLRVFKAQLTVCVTLGIFTFITFCILRYRWPHIYAVRVLRKKDLKALPNNLFGWCLALYRITDDEVLENSGLDAYVFLAFFRMAIKYFAFCASISILFIGPIRYYYTGYFDSDGIAWDDKGDGQTAFITNFIYFMIKKGDGNEDPIDPNQAKATWVYPVFTYVFTLLAFYFLWKQTEIVVAIRQKYLSRQNSITDRTILLEGLPKEFNPSDYTTNSSNESLIPVDENPTVSPLAKFDEARLKNYIEELGIGKVQNVYIASDWTPLKELFLQRDYILRELEVAYSKYYPAQIKVYNTAGSLEPPSVIPIRNAASTENDALLNDDLKRPVTKLGFLGLFGEEVDTIDYYSNKLASIDHQITELRNKNDFKRARSAFVTMDSVASAQMASQTVLDPHVNRLIAKLAPAPHDVCWENLSLSKSNRFLRSNIITIIIGISTVTLIFPVIYLSTFINIKTIQKFWPALAEWIKQSQTATLLFELIPPYLYTLLNVSIPYFYSYLSEFQGYISNSEVELSTLSKNFFYIFFNLFLIFTLAGTASNVWALLGDTTKIAYELANSLKTLSLFYVDLILLQGLGLFPFRLLQVGDVFLEIIAKIFYCRTARDYRLLYYTPPVFNFGLILPQHILILIIAMIYSITSTKIVTAGLIYFILGYYTYKYQLLYTMVHPQHSTGQSWPMIFRRVCLGLILFQITMAGTLALEHAYILAILVIPLIFATFIVIYTFEKDYLPLSFYIALKTIRNSNHSNYLNVNNNDNAQLPRRIHKRKSNIDELREVNITYTYPYLTKSLDGPMIGFEGDYIQLVQYEQNSLNERIVRRYYGVSEWE